MTRSQFVLSWGRKIFFGLGWLLVSLISLNYLQSLIVPQSPIGWAYYVATFIGHIGLLLSVVYFILYVPVVKLFPSYYVARIWSLILLLLGSIGLLLDSIVFSQYRFHLNGFIFNLIFGGAAKDIFEFPFMSYLSISVGVFVVSLVIWMRGEKIWRGMQGRFSNPNGNWYFLIIFFCLVASHGLHIYGSATGTRSITRLASLFPLHFPMTANRLLKRNGIIPERMIVHERKGINDFYYPHQEIKCAGKENKNILFVVIDSWRSDEMDDAVTPAISHTKTHGIHFTNHYSGSNNTRGGIFSIFYSMPATYWDFALNNQTPPVFMDELQKRNYDIGIFAAASLVSPEFDRTVFAKIPDLRISTPGDNSVAKDKQITEDWKAWLKSHQEFRADRPFFGFLFYDSPHAYDMPEDFPKKFEPSAKEINYLFLNNSTDPLPYLNRHKNSVGYVDELVKDVMHDLYLNGLNQDTIVIITGDHGQELNDNKKNFWGHNSNYSPVQTKVPMVVIWPGKDDVQIDRLTTHYDIVPTIMEDAWRCKTKIESYSYGKNLFNLPKRDWVIVASYGDYGILDFDRDLIMTIDPMGDYEVTNMKLTEMSKIKANEKLVFDVLKDLTRFSKKN